MTMLAVDWINSQIAFQGIVHGLAISLIAVGVVLIYRATRIINFAVGSTGLVGATLLALLVGTYHVPFWVALVIALLAGLVFGGLIELSVIRRLRKSPRLVVLIATIGIAQLAQAIAIELPTSKLSEHYPQAISGSWTIAGVNVTGASLSIIVLVPITVVVLGLFLDRTMIGKTVKASASNPSVARLSTISPKLVSTMVWSIAAVISTMAVVLFAGQSSTAGSISALGPQTLSEGLAAAVIAGMVSIPRAVMASAAIGLVMTILDFNFLTVTGLDDAFLFGTVLVAVIFFGKERNEEGQAFSFLPKPQPIPLGLRSYWWARRIDTFGMVLLGIIAVLLPLLFTLPSRQQLFTAVLATAICALSLTLLTGWLGQLSLGQMAFGGLGALFAARLAFEGVPFWLTIPVSTVATALLAVVIGVTSLRVRGLYLAVVTFTFGLAAQQCFYYLRFLSGESPDGQSVNFFRGHLGPLTFVGQRAFYYAVLVILVIVILITSRMRNSSVGRSMKAIRDNETAASAFTLSPAWTKLRTFALGGALAGLGGSLLAGAYASVPFSNSLFLVNDSLVLVAIVVIGGLGSISGAVIGAAWAIGVPAVAPSNQVVELLTSSLGLLLILLYFPQGLNQLVYGIRDSFLAWADRRYGKQVVEERPAVKAVVKRRSLGEISPELAAITVSDLRVRFGGNVALDGVTLRAEQGKITGLIGANGAGKSTLMNAIGGFVSSQGSITLLGQEISASSPSERAKRGLGRTFQAATLFPDLTVRETLLIACESHERSGWVATTLGTPRARRTGRAANAHVDSIIGFLGLAGYQDHRIADLSTGTRRVVELGGLLALEATVLCLDEPTAGLAQRETEAFGPLIEEIRRELNASVLLIEHDMPLIMGISHKVFCLESGFVIAEGDPERIRQDARVIASYLGTDDRAIARSGAMGRPATGASAL